MVTRDFSRMDEAFVSHSGLSDAVARAVKAGTLRKLASRVYTRNLTDLPADIVRRNLWPLVGGLLPGALIADRTALENRPAADGSVFVIADHKRDLALPGITLRPRKGPPPLPSDRPFIAGLHIASVPRAFLENMRSSRARSGVARTLPKAEVEARLETELRVGGEAALERIRDEARAISLELGLNDEYARLHGLISALLGSSDVPLEAPTAIARASGAPYDPLRVELFQVLHAHLANAAPSVRPASSTPGAVLPFFEAYFSNFIEGTEFEVDEAADIVFRGHIPRDRPADAHDILGTWKIVSDDAEMSRTPKSVAELKALLVARHARIMEGRPEKGPGRFKTQSNRAGSTVFVAHELVDGTLAKGFEFYRSLTAPLHRAAFMMFLVAEVHPFADGNGRVARVMMNAELVSAGECRIVVPTVYRSNYLNALRALSHNKVPDALLLVLDFAQRYTRAIDFGTLEAARHGLERTNAFIPANEADDAGKRLVMPTPELLAGRRV